MSPTSRTPQQRDRRFARVRRLTQTIFVGAGIASGVLVGVSAANAKPVTTTTATIPSTVAPSTTPSAHTTTPSAHTTTSTKTKVATVPVAAPVTTTTVCTTSPSGTVTCH